MPDTPGSTKLPADLAASAGAPVGIADPATNTSHEVDPSVDAAAPAPTGVTPASATGAAEPKAPGRFSDVFNYDISQFVPPDLLEQLQKKAGEKTSLGEIFALSGLASANPELATRLIAGKGAEREDALKTLVSLTSQAGMAKRSAMQQQMNWEIQQEKMTKLEDYRNQRLADAEKAQRRTAGTQLTADASKYRVPVGAMPPSAVESDSGYADWASPTQLAVAKERQKELVEQQVAQEIERGLKFGYDPTPRVKELWSSIGVAPGDPAQAQVLKSVQGAVQVKQSLDRVHVEQLSAAAATAKTVTAKTEAELALIDQKVQDYFKTNTKDQTALDDSERKYLEVVGRLGQYKTNALDKASALAATDPTKAAELAAVAGSYDGPIAAAQAGANRIKSQREADRSEARKDLVGTFGDLLSKSGGNWAALDEKTQNMLVRSVGQALQLKYGMKTSEIYDLLNEPVTQRQIQVTDKAVGVRMATTVYQQLEDAYNRPKAPGTEPPKPQGQ